MYPDWVDNRPSFSKANMSESVNFKKLAERPPTGCARQNEALHVRRTNCFDRQQAPSGILVWIGVDNS